MCQEHTCESSGSDQGSRSSRPLSRGFTQRQIWHRFPVTEAVVAEICFQWLLLTPVSSQWCLALNNQKEKKRAREGERERNPLPTGSFPQGTTIARHGKAEARNYIWVCHMGTGTQALRPSSLIFQAINRELKWKWNNTDSDTMGCRHHRHYAALPALISHF